jgi:hypothetical protein
MVSGLDKNGQIAGIIQVRQDSNCARQTITVSLTYQTPTKVEYEIGEKMIIFAQRSVSFLRCNF